MTLWIGIGVCAAGLLGAAAGGRHPWLRAAAMTAALTGFFMAFATALPKPWGSLPPVQGALLLFSAVGLFRALASFEKGR